MLKYDRIDVSEGIDINKTNKSKECVLCHYWYFLDNNFSYGQYLCDGCYIAYFPYMSKRKAKILMTNSNLIDKKGAL